MKEDCVEEIMEDTNRVASNEQDSSEDGFERILGNSPALNSVLGKVRRVAPTDATALVLGETGTGKGLIARVIHNGSPRCARPFIKLNCAAIPFDLLESELFGHEKGAFTGAIAQKIGRFEMADRGTLFLDEIGDIPLALQPKLLRVLQEQEFERVGSGKTHRINVRLIAATHRDLTEMVRRKEFRNDLYYRINVFPVVLPPLRERREDIPQLVSYFVEVFAQRVGKQINRIPKETLDAFTSYSWPGNIRELQNLIERAVICSDNGLLPNPFSTDGTPAVLTSAGGASKIFAPAMTRSDNGVPLNPLHSSDPCPFVPITPVVTRAAHTLKDFERALIQHTLEAAGWVVGGPHGAAVRLGLKRTTLITKMKCLGISRPVRSNDIDELKVRPVQQQWWQQTAE
jgi:formate hydrogenlyase transcriptional activator